MLQRVSLVADQRGHHLGVRAERADDGLLAVLVRAEDRVRIVVGAGDQPVQIGRVGR